MGIQLKYPPCTPGLFSEKPRRHQFEVVSDADNKPILKTINGITRYHTRCIRCGLNDPNPPLH